jgi:Family of unknown function (DUF6188)
VVDTAAAIGQSAPVDSSTLENDDDGWTLQTTDSLVTQLRIDYRFTLMLGSGVLIAISEPFELRTNSATILIPPDDAVYEVGPALPLFNQRIVTLRAAKSGELLIEFDSGTTIRVPTNDGYENWEITLPTRDQLIGLPGGGASYFNAP